jgi:ABC-2 type transport system permease protein
MIAIFLREVKSYFITPIGYIFVGTCSALSGIFFYIMTLAAGSSDITSVFAAMFFVLMILVPLLTMRMFAEEKKRGTDKLLFSAPVGTSEIVLAKFFSAYAVFLAGIFAMFIYGVTLWFFVEIDWLLLLGNCLGIILLGGVYISLGMLISALTENQSAAAVAGIFANLLLFLTSALYLVLPWQAAGNILKFISMYDRFTEFTLGIFNPANIIFFVSIIFVFIFFTSKSVKK